DAAPALHDGVEALERNVHPISSLDLRHAQGLEELLQEHFAGMSRWAMSWKHRGLSVIVGADDVKGVGAGETEHNPILVIDAERVPASQIARQRVQAVTGRDSQVVEPRHRVDLVEFSPDDRPQLDR